MKRFVVALAMIALGGCGIESASTAATVAAMKKRELEEGKKTQERMKQQIDVAIKQDRVKRNEGMRLLQDFEQDLGRSTRLELQTWRSRPLFVRAREKAWSLFGELF